MIIGAGIRRPGIVEKQLRLAALISVFQVAR